MWGVTWEYKAGASHGCSKDKAPGVGMEQGHYSIEAAGTAQAHHISRGHNHGMQEVGPVTVHHSLYADEKKSSWLSAVIAGAS